MRETKEQINIRQAQEREAYIASRHEYLTQCYGDELGEALYDFSYHLPPVEDIFGRRRIIQNLAVELSFVEEESNTDKVQTYSKVLEVLADLIDNKNIQKK